MIFEIVLFLIFFKILLVYTNARCKSKVCLVGKTALITGGNSGLGRETAGSLASKGCRIIIADKDDATATVEALKKETHNPNISSFQVDYASFDSVRKFAKIINSSIDRVDILLNNAGIGDLRYEMTDDGLQKIMQVNYFSHFLLVHLLADLLKKCKARILFASSLAAYTYLNLTTDNIKGQRPEEYLMFSANSYGNSKVCLIIASKMLAEKFQGTGVTSNCYHPGVVRTGIIRRAIDSARGRFKMVVALLALWAEVFGKSVEEGSQPILHLALSDEVENTSGKFFVETYEFIQPRRTWDGDFCRKVWKISEEAVGLKPEEKLSVVLKNKKQ